MTDSKPFGKMTITYPVGFPRREMQQVADAAVRMLGDLYGCRK